LLLVVVLSVGVSAPVAGAAPAPTRVFVALATLSGAEEVPPVTDTHATGTAVYRLSPDGTALHYTLVAAQLTSTPTAAHIHAPAPRGMNAGVVAFLFPPNPHSSCSSASAVLLRCEGVILASDLRGPLANQPLSALITQMAMGLSYTNVHTLRHPDGEIRGQNEPLVDLVVPAPGSS
jgi:hypothetical protein